MWGCFFFYIVETKGREFSFGIIKFEMPNRQPRRALKKMGSNTLGRVTMQLIMQPGTKKIKGSVVEFGF